MSCSVIVIRQVLITDWKTLRYNLQYKVNDSLVLTYRSKEEACLSGIKEKKGSASFKFFSNLNKKVSHFSHQSLYGTDCTVIHFYLVCIRERH